MLSFLFNTLPHCNFTSLCKKPYSLSFKNSLQKKSLQRTIMKLHELYIYIVINRLCLHIFRNLLVAILERNLATGRNQFNIENVWKHTQWSLNGDIERVRIFCMWLDNTNTQKPSLASKGFALKACMFTIWFCSAFSPVNSNKVLSVQPTRTCQTTVIYTCMFERIFLHTAETWT